MLFLILLLILLAITGVLWFVVKVAVGVALGLFIGVALIGAFITWRVRRMLDRTRQQWRRLPNSKVEVLDPNDPRYRH